MHNKLTHAFVSCGNPLKIGKPIRMEKKSMYYDVNNTKICRDHYRPSAGILKLFKSVLAVIMIGESPITHSVVRRRRH